MTRLHATVRVEEGSCGRAASPCCVPLEHLRRAAHQRTTTEDRQSRSCVSAVRAARQSPQLPAKMSSG